MLALLLSTALGLTPAPVVQEASPAWEAVLEQVVPAVVVLRTSATRSFDTQTSGSFTATGFVVDAKRGIILTNRHVTSPGPVVAEAVFQNHEEVEIRPIYRDPVHDFGFFRFDPDAVKFMPVTALELAPEHARVGVEIRVVGNDAGEKLSILAGTLARLDREAPNYGRGQYSDFNTFYLQAASSTSGGSSGSPVVDIHGRVVALNAGGNNRSASSYYLPLDRVVSALEHIQRGEPVPRGTLQTVFVHRPYDELRRLGLRAETEAKMRGLFPEATGALVVRETVPGGPADAILEPGDVLVRVDGRPLASFLPLAEVLDANTAKQIDLELERGGQPITVSVRVDDLHAISPAAYLEVGGAVLNTLSYQQARNFAVPVGGVYVASSGYMLSRAGVPMGAVIKSVDGKPTPTLEEFEKVVAGFADGARVPIRFFRLSSHRNQEVAVITIDRRWHTMQRCVREDETGSWPCVASPSAPEAVPQAVESTHFAVSGDHRTQKIARSLVRVEFHIPYRVSGVPGDRFVGTGLVVDADRGLVVVDQDTVPTSLGDATLTFGGSVEVPGEVVYIHPAHNLAVLSYDPTRLGDTPVKSIEFHPTELSPGDEVWLIGLTESQQVVSEATHILRIEPAALPLPQPPRFRETNVELIRLTDSPSSIGGVLADKRGRVTAMWASFTTEGRKGPHSVFAGLPAALIEEIVEPLRAGRDVGWRSLEAELRSLSLADARNRGLSDEVASRLEEHDPIRPRVLSVKRLAANAPSSEVLEEGDLILAVNGEPVTRPRELELGTRAERVELTVLREGVELTLDVPVSEISGRGLDRAMIWAGALLQAPHRALALQRAIPQEGVYVAWTWWGSPAHRYQLAATRRIVAANGKPTPDLDAFIAAVGSTRDRESVRLKTVDMEGKVRVITLKLDLRYWPAYELRRTQIGWQRTPLASPRTAFSELDPTL